MSVDPMRTTRQVMPTIDAGPAQCRRHESLRSEEGRAECPRRDYGPNSRPEALEAERLSLKGSPGFVENQFDAVV